MSSIRYEKDATGVVTLLLDAPDQPVNTMNAAFQADLREVVDRLAAEREQIRGVIFASPKRTFFAGGDLRALMAVRATDAAAFFRELEALKACLRRIEQLGRPVVAAINGSALGGGFELALSCHARLCIDDPAIEIGFPEVTLGLLPGAGGVVKTVRLLGLQNALPLLSEGRRLAPATARSMGLVDGLARDRDELLASARAWIDAHPDARQPWDEPGHRIPGGTPSSPAVAGALPIAPAILHQQTRGNFPAPEAILAAAVEGAQVDFDTAMRIESRYMTRLVTGQVAKNMIGTLFFQLNDVKAGKSRPAGLPHWRAGRVGILGAGMMGAGIAWACASRGVPCVLKDVDLATAQKGKDYSARLLAGRVGKGRTPAAEAEKVLAAIAPSADVADLSGCDLVIEAVYENREVKAQVTREAEAVLDADAIFASNTSTLPITGLSEASTRPGQFIGLHFFSPVDRMQLVEIIRGQRTTAETLARAFDFVLQIGKTPIVVNDARGFYTSRVFGTFVNEGMALLGEGVPAATVENAGWQIGMPVGPLAVLDEVSLKLADDVLHQELADLERERCAHEHEHDHDGGHAHGHAHAHAHRHDHHGSGHTKGTGSSAGHRHTHNVKSRRIPESAVYVLEKMAHGFGRMGRAHGGGFYDYPQHGGKTLWPGLTVFERGGRSIPFEDVKDRMLYVQAIETIRCLQQGVLESTRDANIGSIFGWGFPAWTGGTIQFVNHVGVRAFAARAQALAQRYGERFAPPELLSKHAEQGTPL